MIMIRSQYDPIHRMLVVCEMGYEKSGSASTQLVRRALAVLQISNVAIPALYRQYCTLHTAANAVDIFDSGSI
jgi:hypothetical protein